jgi:hypothetical protein
VKYRQKKLEREIRKTENRNRNQGSILSTKILSSENFSVKIKNIVNRPILSQAPEK